MIKVFREGSEISGWKSVSVGLSLSSVCNGFSFEQFVGDDFSSPVLFPGDAVRIENDGVLLLDGFVDGTDISFSADSHSIVVNGREKTCDLVDGSLSDYGRSWKNKTPQQIIEDICSSFGLMFSYNGVKSGTKIVRFCPDPGCTGLDAIMDVCKQRDLYCTSFGDGVVRLVNTDAYEYVTDMIEQGKNIISASANFSNADRFKKYTVLCSSNVKSKRKGEAVDDEILRDRCMVVVDDGFENSGSAEQKAAYEAQMRSARSTSVRVTLSGWRMSNGKLWKPGTLVDCLIPAFFGKNVQTLLVNSVIFTYDNSGSFVDLNLVRSDYYTPMPHRKKKSKANPWAGIQQKTSAYEASR